MKSHEEVNASVRPLSAATLRRLVGGPVDAREFDAVDLADALDVTPHSEDGRGLAIDTTHARLMGYVEEMQARRPEGFALISHLRQLDTIWPKWCWCPLSSMLGNAHHAYPPIDVCSMRDVELVKDLARVLCLDTWWFAKKIYKWPLALPRAPRVEVDADLLRMMPVRCLYVESGGSASWLGKPMLGFFAWLDYYDEEEGRPPVTELWLCPDTGALAAPVNIRCGGTLYEGAQLPGRGADLAAALARRLRPMVAAVLEICQDNDREPDEVREPSERASGRPAPAAAWDTDVRFGEKVLLLGAESRSGASSASAGARRSTRKGKSHASPRPHIRSKHKRGVWVGSGDERHRKIREVESYAVCVPKDRQEETEELPTVIHRVELGGGDDGSGGAE